MQRKPYLLTPNDASADRRCADVVCSISEQDHFPADKQILRTPPALLLFVLHPQSSKFAFFLTSTFVMSQHILDTGTFNPSSDGRPSNPLYLSQKIGEAIRSGGAPGKEYTAPRANSTTRGVTFETMTDARCTSAWHTMRMAFDGRAIITLRWDQGIIGSLAQRGPTTGRLAVAARSGRDLYPRFWRSPSLMVFPQRLPSRSQLHIRLCSGPLLCNVSLAQRDATIKNTPVYLGTKSTVMRGYRINARCPDTNLRFCKLQLYNLI